MLVSDAQREVRQVYRGGFQGQVVSGAIWLASAAAWTWSGPRAGILTLVAAGFFIYPLTQLLLKLAGGPVSLSEGNPLRSLAIQVAFTLPLNLPLVGAAALHRVEWFYPAFMIALGTHYLPFAFLYGMPAFGVLAGLLVAGGVGLGLWAPGAALAGAWGTGLLLVAFAFVGRRCAR